VNTATFVGNLGRDPETRTVGDNVVCNFSIAVRRAKKKGEEQDPIWVKCTAWGKTAEIAEQYLKKGHQVCVTGSVDLESWKDKDGNTRTDMTCNITSLSLLKNGDEPGGGSRDEGRRDDRRRDDQDSRSRGDRRDDRRDDDRSRGSSKPSSKSVEDTW
jgi:single-strand DNA-binding protein